MTRLVLALFVALLSMASQSNAAVLGFKGKLTGAFANTFGVNPGDFTGSATLGPFSGGTATITNFSFAFSGPATVSTPVLLNLSSASISGTNLNFNITGIFPTVTNTGSPITSMVMTFGYTGNTGITDSNALSYIYGRTADSFNVQFNGPANSYGGSITAVPEPGSMIAVAAITLLGGGYRLRKRWTAKS